MPLTDSLQTLGPDTNLFVLYLGDLNFKNTIKPNILVSNNSVYDFELLNFKLEFWEDYSDAIEALNYYSNPLVEIQKHMKNNQNIEKPAPSFIIMDFSAFLQYAVKGMDSSMSFISSPYSSLFIQ